jgi:hypothetical protein
MGMYSVPRVKLRAKGAFRSRNNRIQGDVSALGEIHLRSRNGRVLGYYGVKSVEIQRTLPEERAPLHLEIRRTSQARNWSES